MVLSDVFPRVESMLSGMVTSELGLNFVSIMFSPHKVTCSACQKAMACEGSGIAGAG